MSGLKSYMQQIRVEQTLPILAHIFEGNKYGLAEIVADLQAEYNTTLREMQKDDPEGPWYDSIGMFHLNSEVPYYHFKCLKVSDPALVLEAMVFGIEENHPHLTRYGRS